MAFAGMNIFVDEKGIRRRYKKALSRERKNPGRARRIYTENLMLVKPMSSPDYDRLGTLKIVFVIAGVIGFLLSASNLEGKSPLFALFSLIFGAVFFGAFHAGIVWAIMRVHQDTTKLTKKTVFWITILAYIGASRCSLRLKEPDDAIWYSRQAKKFDLSVIKHLSDGIIAMAEEDWARAEYALSIAAHMAPPGKYQAQINEAIYEVVQLHPAKEDVLRRDAGGYHTQDYNVQHVHGDVVYGQTNVDIRDSVVQRSRIGNRDYRGEVRYRRKHVRERDEDDW